MKRICSHTAILVFLVFVIWSCTKQPEELVMNDDYLHVADALENCQGFCDEENGWEGKEILVKGWLRDAGDDPVMSGYYQDEKFFLADQRNGMFLEIQVEDDKDAIFTILFGLKKGDKVYIRGLAESIIVNKGDECEKGVIITLNNSENMNINL